MLFLMLLIAATPILIIANEQNSDDAVEIDNGPMAYGQFNGKEDEVTSHPICNCNEQFEECMENCDTIALYDPVCGTDGVTYGNLGELACAQCCGKDVTMEHSGMCKESATE
ncbi:PREDICTED: thrombin inhibitor rhodniin-like [Cyphomyrmex costatus]|uniref:thrombin inhibitor rhodniin-like n=1 Tax=Cyphomyrmex costatus TaxID=456900 RepID=UPI0008523E06|nr:PREDICTED: thrombin inhibitor rhodniin-like [Cyphomyrmex costatus]